MGGWRRSARALSTGVSVLALFAGTTANAQVVLDPITILATKTEEKAIETLASLSTVRQDQLNQIMPSRPSELFFGLPSVWFQERADDPATSINIRGLQDFGRVNVLIDGARQNFQKSGHNANGAFYLEPELLSGADVVRGPVANIYGSGALGGVVSFQTKDIDDVVKPGQRWGVLAGVMAGSNLAKGLGSLFGGVRVTPNVDIFAGATYRSHSNYVTGLNGLAIAGLPAPGKEVPNSGFDVQSGIAKATVRPADGHEIKLTGITYNSDYVTGQPPSSTFDTKVKNDIVSARWRYARPDDRLFNVDANVYWTDTRQDQLKLTGATSTSTGRIGDRRFFDLQTVGFDANNTSRIETGPVRHAFTYGLDAFKDRVNVLDPGGANDQFTPSGERSVYGGFLQWKMNVATWLEVISAGRYDGYELSGLGTTSSGERLSPKITVGVTPINGFTVYGTYAEGYRAPALTETIAAGFHPPFASFPGAPAGFQFLPNPGLRPEVGKTKEVGVNLRHDSLILSEDKLRAKLAAFRNDVDDYIDAVAFGPVNFWGLPAFYQYQNVAQARIEGVEAEGNYDAGAWFLGLGAHRIRGKNLGTGLPLATIPPDQVTTTFGVRFFDRKVTAAVKWQAVDAKTDVPPGFTPRSSYNLVNLYLGYQPTEDVLAGISVENVLNTYYVRYLDALPSPGVTVKGSLKLRFGA